MKCQKCGKNEANCYYRTNINGTITESHLCSECAREMEQGSQNVFGDFFAETDNFFRGFQDMFDGFFGRNSLFGGFGMMPMAMLFPRMSLRLDSAAPQGSATTQAKPEAAPAADPETDPELAKKRELNMLRQQMQDAIAKEEFEKAAEIRDKIREMDQK